MENTFKLRFDRFNITYLLFARRRLSVINRMDQLVQTPMCILSFVQFIVSTMERLAAMFG